MEKTNYDFKSNSFSEVMKAHTASKPLWTFMPLLGSTHFSVL